MTSAPAVGLSGCPRGNMWWLWASQRTVSGSGRPAGQRMGGLRAASQRPAVCRSAGPDVDGRAAAHSSAA